MRSEVIDMLYECLKQDRRRRGVAADWDCWLREASKIYGQYLARIDASPFEFNEVSAVGFLTAAAAKAGFLTLNEYEITKRDKRDRRCKVPGRADLWMCEGQRSYSFEFKRAYHAITIKNLEETMARAMSDIQVIDRGESHYAAGVVLAYVRDEERLARYRSFAERADVHFAYRIGPNEARGGYVYFALK